MEQKFLKFVAEIMEADASELTMDTAYGRFNGWDSMMHMRLVMELEEEYGVEIPIDKIPEIKTLRDFYVYVNQFSS